MFFVRRLSTWIVRRTSSSRPITGSSLPCARLLGEVAAVPLERPVRVLGVLARHAAAAADLGERREGAVARDAGLLQEPPAPPPCSPSIASSRCSVEMYSSVSCSASVPAAASMPGGLRREPHLAPGCP